MPRERFAPINPANWNKEGVPAHLQHACNVLNEALDIDPFAVSTLFDYDTNFFEHGATKRFEQHPTIVLGGDGRGEPCLSVFGLLAGTVNTEHFRLAYDTQPAKIGQIGPEHVLRIYIVQVVLEPDAA